MKKMGSSRRLRAVLAASLTLGTLSAGACVSAAEGEEAAAQHDLGDTVVTATRTPNMELKANANITVITGRDIERRHYTDLTQALRDVPGLVINQYGRRAITTAASFSSTARRMLLCLLMEYGRTMRAVRGRPSRPR